MKRKAQVVNKVEESWIHKAEHRPNYVIRAEEELRGIEANLHLFEENRRAIYSEMIRRKRMYLNQGFVRHLGVPTVGHILKDKGALYIGRYNSHHGLQRSFWSNPFRIEKGASEEERAHCIAQYKNYLQDILHRFPQKILELKGRTLGCWCRCSTDSCPSCHGDVLADFYRVYATEMFIRFGYKEVENGSGIFELGTLDRHPSMKDENISAFFHPDSDTTTDE